MLDVFKNVANHLKIREVNLDNHVFKLFSIGSVAICLLGALMCAATQYFGDPITCEFDGSISSDFAKRYCWIHGSNWIPREYQEDFDCIVSQNNINSEADAPDTSYYQWVVFFLILQAGLFVFPYKIWKVTDKGLIEGFVCQEAKSAFILSDEEKCLDLIKLYVKQFNSILHHNTRYFATFVACELLNVIFLYVNFYATNSFLNGKFSTYGFDAVTYYNTQPALRTVNPMCDVFPTKVSCNLHIVGEGGTPNKRNGLCILAQNIVNEKFFVALFFWYIMLFIVSAFFIIFRLTTIVVPVVRHKVLAHRIKGRHMDYCLRSVLSKCQIGDWFVLDQIAKNVNPYFFREFLEVLEQEIGTKPRSLRGNRNEHDTPLFKLDNDKVENGAEILSMETLQKE